MFPNCDSTLEPCNKTGNSYVAEKEENMTTQHLINKQLYGYYPLKANLLSNYYCNIFLENQKVLLTYQL